MYSVLKISTYPTRLLIDIIPIKVILSTPPVDALDDGMISLNAQLAQQNNPLIQQESCEAIYQNTVDLQYTDMRAEAQLYTKLRIEVANKIGRALNEGNREEAARLKSEVAFFTAKCEEAHKRAS